MADVTRLLDAAAAGDRQAAADLLPPVYDELRQLAAARMAPEAPGQTLQPTALVHEANLRLAGQLAPAEPPGANVAHPGHFFARPRPAPTRAPANTARPARPPRHPRPTDPAKPGPGRVRHVRVCP